MNNNQWYKEDENQKILVVCSFSDQMESWRAPLGFDMESAKLCLCNYESSEKYCFYPYETRVYLWYNNSKN